MSTKPVAKRNMFDKLPTHLIGKISNMNTYTNLPVEVVINTVITVSRTELQVVSVKHTFDVGHESKVLKPKMPSGFVDTYLQQFREGTMIRPDNIKPVQYKLYFDNELDSVIERYEISSKQTDGLQRNNIFIYRENNNKIDIMGMRCINTETWRKKQGDNVRVIMVTDTYKPIKKEKAKVSKELSFYNVKF